MRPLIPWVRWVSKESLFGTQPNTNRLSSLYWLLAVGWLNMILCPIHIQNVSLTSCNGLGILSLFIQ